MPGSSALRLLLLTTVLVATFCGDSVFAQRRGFSSRSCPSGCVCLISTVRCTHHRLDTIPRIPPDTRTLDLRFNMIEDIPSGTFRGLRKINSILLNNNRIARIDEDAFHGLNSLRYLYLYKNRIHSIHKRGFRGLTSLLQLYLYDNRLETLHPMTFSTLPNLQRLFLQGNKLKTLPSVLFNHLTHLKRIRVDGNPLQCDCHLSWFATFIRAKGNRIHASATCSLPRSVAGQAISSLREEAFECKQGVPTIVVHPEDATVRQGFTVRFQCRASGNPAPSISWNHNGEEIETDTRVRFLSDGTLMIQRPKASDQGKYECVAENIAGSVKSEPAILKYKSTQGPPVFTVQPSDAQVMLNEHVTFYCRATGNPQPVTRWYRNGGRLPVVPNYIIMPETLHIRQASLEDNGTFTCVAANSEGKVNSSAHLLVGSPPVFSLTPGDSTAIQGQSTTLQCHARGIPTPEITWLKDGRSLVRDQRYLVMSTGSLLIRAISVSDEGTYTCRASSSSGAVSSDGFLSINVPPHFTVRPQNQRVRQGITVDFQCQVAGRPTPHTVWTVNNRAVPSDPRYVHLPSGTLRLLRAQLSDAGTYRCEAANPVGAQHAQVTLTIIPQTPLSFVRTPTDQEVASGSDVKITCQVTGGGTNTDMFWTKDGVRIVSTGTDRYQITPSPSSILTISRVGRDDSGRYECTARSMGDVITASMRLNVIIESSVEDIVGTLDGILPPNCLKHGCTQELTEHDFDDNLEEVYRPFIEPSPQRRKRQSDVTRYSDVVQTVGSASNVVNRGIGQTIDYFNNRDNRQTAGELISLMRFPASQLGVDLTKAAEVFDVSLRMIECCVRRGMQIRRFSLSRKRQQGNTTVSHPQVTTRANLDPEFDLDPPVLSPEVVELVANLSGCSGHRAIPDCSKDICFHRKYRTADGTCNNLQFPLWGASLTPFHRLLQPIYENGFNAPVAWDSAKKYNNHSLPSPRSVSVGVLMSAGSRPPRHDPLFTHMVMQWGQFLDHDLDFTTMAPSIHRFSDGKACKDSCEREGPCFPIGVDRDDPRHGRFHHHAPPTSSTRRGSRDRHASDTCMEFTRSSAVCGSGITSVFSSAISRREQINQITSYHDASNVYGSSENATNNLRDLTSQEGLLKEGQSLEVGHKPLLPYNVYSELEAGGGFSPVAPIECRRGDGESPQQRSVPCFLAGDLRANEQVSLTAMHTMWMREHNRVARYLKRANQHWDGDTIFHETRKIIGAMMQHITYKQWLPKLLGPFMERIGTYGGYNPGLPSSVVNVFATAAYRFGHTMINPVMFRLNETWGESPQGNLMLHQAFFAPFRIVHEGGIDPLIRGLIAKPMKARDSDSSINAELIERLFSMAEEVALDLGALNIQRGRDHGLPFYGDWRIFCNLSRAEDFEDLAEEIKSPQVRAKLRDLYKVTSNIDPFVGMIVEDVMPGSRLGPTLGCLLAEQFKRTRDGDRLWHENPGVFSPAQLTAIRQTSLARLICDNTDSISHLPRDVFLNQPAADFVSCDEVPSVDLSAWVDCCTNCDEAGSFETLSGHVRERARTKRSLDGAPYTEKLTFENDLHLKLDDTKTDDVSSDVTPIDDDVAKSSDVTSIDDDVKKSDVTNTLDQTNQIESLIQIVTSLEKRVTDLQGEVRHLEGKLKDKQ